MGTEPDGLRNRAAALLGDDLRHPGHQEAVLAVRLAHAVVLGAADRNEDDVVFLQPLLHSVAGLILEVDVLRAVQIPF
jgi:hypothetical protein